MKTATLLFAFGLLAQAQPPRIRPDVAALLERQETAPVFIVLKNLPKNDQPQRTLAAGANAFAEMERALASQQSRLETKLRALGAEQLARYTAVNMLTAEIPRTALVGLDNDPEIDYVFLSKTRHADLQNSVPLLGAPAFWNIGFTGVGQSVAVIDTGVKTDHPAFAGMTIISRTFLNFGKSAACFDDDATSAEDGQGHGTHVAGIIASHGSAGFTAYTGVAKGLTTLYNLKAAYKSKTTGTCGAESGVGDDRDIFQAVQWAVLNTPSRILNLSFGAPVTADDDDFALTIDQMVDNASAFLAVSAGNSGPATSTLGSPGIAYNTVTVANASSASAVNGSSSRGPTVGGRYKPDIAAPGTSIVSTAFDWATAGRPAFVAKTGTSMSAPHIAGAAALLRQAGVTNSLNMKAVLLNSTGSSDWQPDRGWGFANLNLTVFQTAFVDSNSIGPGQYKFYRVASPGTMTATLVWNRHVPGTFSDLDLYSYSLSSGALLAQSTTGNQNVERVAPQSGADVVLKVRNEATGTIPEAFGLAASKSLARATGPQLSASCTQAASAIINTALTSACTVNNKGDLPAFDVMLTLTSPDRTESLSVGSLQPGGVFSKNTTFLSSTVGSKNFTISAASSTYGETFNATTTYPISVILDPNFPAAPSSPNPAANAFNINTGGTLSWNPSAPATSYDVSLGTTNPPTAFASSIASASVAFSGLTPNTVYFWRVSARNSAGSTPGDVWQFTTGANAAPAVTSYSATGSTMTFVFSDSNTASDLGIVNVLINLYLDGRNACYIAYDSKGGTLYLVGDNGSSLTGIALPSAAILSNSQCAISAAGVTATKAGNALTLTIPYTFTTAFGAATQGSKIIYAAARDTLSANSGWQPMGTFRVAIPTTDPVVISASPSPLVTAVPITVTYRHSIDSHALQPAQILINSALDGRSACYVGFDHTGNTLGLVRDDGNGLIAGSYIRLNNAPGGSASIENSQCKIVAAGSTYADSGQLLTITLNIQLNPTFTGRRIVYAGVQTTTGGNSGWTAVSAGTFF